REIFQFCWIRMRLRVTDQYMTALCEKKARLEYKHIENAETWDLIKRVCGGELAAGATKYEALEKMIDGYHSIHLLVIAITRVLGLLSVFVAYAWWTAIVVVGLTVPITWLSAKSGKRSYGAEKDSQTDIRRVEYLGEVLRGRDYATERSLFGYSERLGEKFAKHRQVAISNRTGASFKNMLSSNFAALFSLTIWFVVAISLLPSVAGGVVTLGMYIAMITSVTDLVHSVEMRLFYAVSNLTGSREYIKDLEAFVALSETPDATAAPQAGYREIREIEFRGVRFAYPGTESVILDGVDLKIKEGVRYAFVGANGAGKSTIIKLLTGLYPEYEGEILINGKELRDYTASEQKAMFALVHQDFARYAISMEDNIAIGNVNAMEAGTVRVSEAVEAVGLDSEVAKLPEGLATELGKLHEGGHDLSGGQWQRVAIARATVSDAPVVILDEPTAALDPLAESALYAEFGRISRGKTSVFISHRLGSTKLADVIYVLDKGKIAEVGSHDELMSAGGLYADMYEAQKEWYV
ncbi:MAG: ABC transporter ATP-binding protein, partial [Clostridia bacterium]|nr:ABC transporter ATP-binding protein [Clostridia bacterium]